MKNKKGKIAKILLLTIIVLIIGIIFWYVLSTKCVNKNNSEEIEVLIPLGTGTSGIADILKENNIIKSKTAFKVYVKLNNVTNFQAGKYYLNPCFVLNNIFLLEN